MKNHQLNPRRMNFILIISLASLIISCQKEIKLPAVEFEIKTPDGQMVSGNATNCTYPHY